MKRRGIYYFYLLTTIGAALQMMSWACAAAPTTIDVAHHHQDTVQVLQSPQLPFPSKQRLEKVDQQKRNEEEYNYRTGLSKLGSRPPNCKHKCGGCTPCIAIQVPKTTTHLVVQYTNYEPEGWKCKCGSALFNP